MSLGERPEYVLLGQFLGLRPDPSPGRIVRVVMGIVDGEPVKAHSIGEQVVPVNRGESPSDWILNIGSHPGLDLVAPGLAYNSVLSFGPGVGAALLSMAVDESGGTEASVLEGSLVMKSGQHSLTLEELERATGTPDEPLPTSPETVRATVVDIQTTAPAEDSLEVDGKDIHEMEGAGILREADGHQVYWHGGAFGALTAVRNGGYELILVDVQMPGIDCGKVASLVFLWDCP